MPELEGGHYASPRWSYELLDCAMPMTLDTYSNCAFQCVYCFAYFQRAVGTGADDYLSHKVKSVDVEKIKRMFLDPDKHGGQFGWYIKQRKVLQWGGLSDGFDWYEKKFRKSLELLRFFREIGYPISISTKGTWFWDDEEYVDAFRDASNVHLKYSIITTSDAAAEKLEAGAPTPGDRFAALRKAADVGVHARTLRFRPYILGVSDLCDEEMLDRAQEARCTSVTTEMLCLEGRASKTAKERYRRISEVCGFDVLQMYTRYSDRASGYMRLNYDIKRKYIERMERMAKERGLKFYVSDAHHKEKSEGANCCGAEFGTGPDEKPQPSSCCGQFTGAILIAKKHGQVSFSDIAEDAEGWKNVPWITAAGFNTGGAETEAKYYHHSMFDYLRAIWNDPHSWQSPARYFGGVLVPAEKDAAGDVVYVYNAPFVEGGTRLKSVAEIRGARQF